MMAHEVRTCVCIPHTMLAYKGSRSITMRKEKCMGKGTGTGTETDMRATYFVRDRSGSHPRPKRSARCIVRDLYIDPFLMDARSVIEQAVRRVDEAAAKNIKIPFFDLVEPTAEPLAEQKEKKYEKLTADDEVILRAAKEGPPPQGARARHLRNEGV